MNTDSQPVSSLSGHSALLSNRLSSIHALRVFSTFIFLFLLSSSIAFAGTYTGKITGYIPFSTGADEVLFIKLEQNQNTPACNYTLRLTMKSSHPRFKSTQSAALAAMMSGTPVVANGSGTCTNWYNAEDLEYICLGDIPC